MFSRLLAFVIWATLACSTMYWILLLIAQPVVVPIQTLPVSIEQSAHGDLRRLFQSPQRIAEVVAPELTSRFRLIGIIAPERQHTQGGVALIAIDGKPPRAFQIGQQLDADVILQAISQQGVKLGPVNGPAIGTLHAPTLPPPNIGVLPSPQGLMSGAAPAIGTGKKSQLDRGFY